MRSFRDRSIETKLRLLTTTAVAVALGLACTAFVVNDVWRIRTSKVQQLSTLAQVLGANTAAALDFHDSDTAAELLSSLREEPMVEFACLYDARGKPFATYPKQFPPTITIPPVPSTSGATFTDSGHLEVVHELRRPGEKVGVLLLRAGMHDLRAQLIQCAWMAIVATVGALVVSLLLTGRLQRLITTPILNLFNVVQRVSEEGDYALRVEESGRDELGTLCKGFNAMLARIELARGELLRAHDQLEERVAQRTEELTRTNEELQQAMQAAEAANRAKSHFLANMSHEIRTPMTAILGYIDLLTEQDIPPADRHEYIETIRRNGEGLLRIIDDILDISKIEAGRMTVERIACSPLSIVAEVASLMRPRAIAKNLSLDVEFGGAIPETIHTDPTRLRQILTNLVGNAVKFTESGGVRLVVRMVDPPEAPAARIAFEVIDTGVGMSPEQFGRVFKAFSQGDESMTRRFGGTGLGLAISRHLACMLGGDIRVDSTLGKGSRFVVSIPTGPLEDVRMHEPSGVTVGSAVKRTSRSAPDTALHDTRLLLAEDGPDNQRLISFILRRAGAQVTVVENGRLAVEHALQAREAGQPFDVILMDMQMPVMDGYCATGRLRAQGYAGPIIALTAHAMSQDRQRCLDCGCDNYMTKPIDRDNLLRLVAEYAGTRTDQTASAHTPVAAPAPAAPPSGGAPRTADPA